MAETTFTLSGDISLSSIPVGDEVIYFDEGATLEVAATDIVPLGSLYTIGHTLENFDASDSIVVHGLDGLVPGLSALNGELAGVELTVSPTGELSNSLPFPLDIIADSALQHFVNEVTEALFGTETPGVTLGITLNLDNGDLDATITASGLVTCYAPGTMIATPEGERKVEDIAAGDLVLTAEGASMPVRWAGNFVADLEHSTKPETLRPVHIAPGALGNTLPKRELIVSPDHSLYLNGGLVPARLLLNGTTITQPTITGSVTYHHLEIDPHGILLAEGAPAESFLDLGTTMFSRQDQEPKTWEDACAPIILAGPRLDAIRACLAEPAAA